MMNLPKPWGSFSTRVALAVMLSVFFAVMPTARAQTDPDEGWTLAEQTIPITLDQMNACNGDSVRLTGQGTMITRTKVQPDGTLSVKTSVSMSLTGTGIPSGADYVYSDSSLTNINGVGSLPYSFFVNRSAKLSAKGVPDMFLHAVAHVTINADGTVTHDLLNLLINCTP